MSNIFYFRSYIMTYITNTWHAAQFMNTEWILKFLLSITTLKTVIILDLLCSSLYFPLCFNFLLQSFCNLWKISLGLPTSISLSAGRSPRGARRPRVVEAARRVEARDEVPARPPPPTGRAAWPSRRPSRGAGRSEPPAEPSRITIQYKYV